MFASAIVMCCIGFGELGSASGELGAAFWRARSISFSVNPHMAGGTMWMGEALGWGCHVLSLWCALYVVLWLCVLHAPTGDAELDDVRWLFEDLV